MGSSPHRFAVHPGVNHLQHTKWIALAAVALKLPHIMLKAASALKHWTLDINTLMTIAVAGGPSLQLPCSLDLQQTAQHSMSMSLTSFVKRCYRLSRGSTPGGTCAGAQTLKLHINCRCGRDWAVHGGGCGGGAVLRRGAPGAQLQVRRSGLSCVLDAVSCFVFVVPIDSLERLHSCLLSIWISTCWGLGMRPGGEC